MASQQAQMGNGNETLGLWFFDAARWKSVILCVRTPKSNKNQLTRPGTPNRYERERKYCKLKFIYAMFTSNGHQFAWCINIQFNRVYSPILSHSHFLRSLLTQSEMPLSRRKRRLQSVRFTRSHQTNDFLLLNIYFLTFAKVLAVFLPFLFPTSFDCTLDHSVPVLDSYQEGEFAIQNALNERNDWF